MTPDDNDDENKNGQNDGEEIWRLDYHSWNRETGLLEDVEEIKKVGIMLARTVRNMVKYESRNPIAQLLGPDPIFLGLAADAAKAEAMLRPMSQAEQYRLVKEATGYNNPVEDMILREIGGLDEHLPASHPEATARLDRGLERFGLPSQSDAAKVRADEKQETMWSGKYDKPDPEPAHPTELPPPLPDGIENFLRSLGGKSGVEGDQDKKDN